MKDSKIYKVLRIVFLTLAIISMVFALMKKVGLAASDSQNPDSYDSFPLPFGLTTSMGFDTSNTNLVNYLNTIDFDYAITYGISQGLPSDVDTVVIQEVGARYLTLGLVKSNGISYTSAGSDVLPLNTSVKYNYRYLIRYDMQSGNTNFSFWGGGNGTYTCDLTNSNFHLPDGSISSGVTIINYPIYSQVTDLVSNNDNKVLFSKNAGGGFDSPGWSDAFDEWIEDEINPVDIDSPIDSSNTPGWLQKILGGLGTINNTIGSGFTLIKNNLGSTRDKITEIFDYITEEPNPAVIGNNVAAAIYETELFTSFDSAKTSITGVYNGFSNVSARTSSQVAFSIPFSLPYIDFSSNFVIDFAWYENVRSVIEPFLNMVLSVGFLFSLIRSIPGILHGNSGEGDT